MVIEEAGRPGFYVISNRSARRTHLHLRFRFQACSLRVSGRRITEKPRLNRAPDVVQSSLQLVDVLVQTLGHHVFDWGEIA